MASHPVLLLRMALWLPLLLVLCIPEFFRGGGADAARILGIFPTPSLSHQLPYQAVMKALAARGHEITVISTHPLQEPVANYTDIDLSFSVATYRRIFNFVSLGDISGINLMKEFATVAPAIVDEQLDSSQIKEFLRSNANKKFDLVFLEWISYQAYFGLIHAVGSPPIVGIISLGGMPSIYNAIGNPNNPAINPDVFYSFSDEMTFYERAYNTYIYLWTTYFWETKIFSIQEALMRKHFGDAPPPVPETERNLSLVVLNNHWTTDYPRALLPNVVQLTGLHIKEKPNPLPKDLKQWLDAAKDGVVYFSLGSNVQSKDLPEETQAAILRAFGRLSQRVLWKWEGDALNEQPENVRVGKWLPQQAVLAHPNIRLFVTQGGLQSFQEAVYHGVPLLGIPFLGDQPFNVHKMVTAGVGRLLELSALNEHSLYTHITSMLQDHSYKERIREMSAVYREHRATSLDTALWWIEYVLRHNGAPHLRSAVLNLTWYQYLLLDVVAVVLVVVAIFISILWMMCRAICGRRKRNVSPVKKHQ